MNESMIWKFPWESDEAQAWESDEAIAESEESAEDIGERARQRRIPPRARGIRRGAMIGPDGARRNLQFQAPVASVAEVNRVSSDLAGRINRLEQRSQAYQKNASSVGAAVSTAFIFGLGSFALFKVAGGPSKSGSKFKDFTNETAAKGAAVAATGHVVAAAAQRIFTGRPPRSAFVAAANITAVLYLGAFTVGSILPPPPIIRRVQNIGEAIIHMNTGDPVGTLYETPNKALYQSRLDPRTGDKELVQIYSP